MKVDTNIKIYASVGLTLGLLAGCGGGSDSDSSSSLASLTPETSELIAKNISDALPGCTFVSEGVAAKASDASVAVIKTSVDQLLSYKKASSDLLSVPVIRASVIDEAFQGTCPSFPGTYTLTGTHEDGVDDVVMTFNDFCLGTDIEHTIIAGAIDMKSVGEPSDLGPIPQYMEISTGSAGVQVTEKSAEGTFIHSANIDDLKVAYGNGDDDPTLDKPNTLAADAISIVDGRSGDEFNVSNVDVSMYVSGTDDVVTVKGVTFEDPDYGQFTLSTSSLVMDEDGVVKSGTITATGADDTSMVITPSSTADNVFGVVVDGQSIGDMNCTDVDIDTGLLEE